MPRCSRWQIYSGQGPKSDDVVLRPRVPCLLERDDHEGGDRDQLERQPGRDPGDAAPVLSAEPAEEPMMNLAQPRVAKTCRS